MADSTKNFWNSRERRRRSSSDAKGATSRREPSKLNRTTWRAGKRVRMHVCACLLMSAHYNSPPADGGANEEKRTKK